MLCIADIGIFTLGYINSNTTWQSAHLKKVIFIYFNGGILSKTVKVCKLWLPNESAEKLVLWMSVKTAHNNWLLKTIVGSLMTNR